MPNDIFGTVNAYVHPVIGNAAEALSPSRVSVEPHSFARHAPTPFALTPGRDVRKILDTIDASVRVVAGVGISWASHGSPRLTCVEEQRLATKTVTPAVLSGTAIEVELQRVVSAALPAVARVTSAASVCRTRSVGVVAGKPQALAPVAPAPVALHCVCWACEADETHTGCGDAEAASSAQPEQPSA